MRILLLALFLVGCVWQGKKSDSQQPGLVTIATPSPSPLSSSLPLAVDTSVHTLPTMESQATLTSEEAFTPIAGDTAFLLPPLLPTPVALVAPEAAIQIHAPGPMSSVRSPIRLRGYLLPGYRNRVHIALIGEDGRLLARHLLYAYTSQRFAYFSIEVPFEIRGVSELARLQVSTEDELGRTKALSSVRLLLLSNGYEDINPPGDLKERCVLFSPLPEAIMSGGVVFVTGYARPLDDLPLLIELIGAQGQAISSRLASLPAPEANGYSPFAVEVPYIVSEPLKVQLVVRQLDGRIGGTMYIYSQEITLAP